MLKIADEVFLTIIQVQKQTFHTSTHTQTTHKHPRTYTNTLLWGYYGLSLFNSCSLNAPDNDKAPQSLTASLLTLSLLSLSASHSRPSLVRFVSIVWHSRTIWRRPEPPLKHPYSSQTRTCEREKYQLETERTICKSLGMSDTACHLLVI